MKLERLVYDPNLALAFYEEGLSALGALCERSWHDRLDVVAEGRAAALWGVAGELYSGELHFAASDASAARESSRQVFPGSPLTFKLAEALRPSPLPLERLVLGGEACGGAPESSTLERHWRSQFPQTGRWSIADAPKPAWHFSLVALVRIEVQAIDQHWYLHRVAMALPNGESDEHLARELDFTVPGQPNTDPVPWPALEPGLCVRFVSAALQEEISPDLTAIRARQEANLRREFERIDGYFENYAAELDARGRRSGSETVRIKTTERLAAARAEHARRRADQVARHEIRILPYLDALLLVGELAWSAELRLERGRESESLRALYLRRSRRWYPAKS